MRRPRRLSPEERARLAEFRDEWQRCALSTAPADRPAAEAGARQAYRRAGLPPPQHIVWVPSPWAGAIAATMFGQSLHGRIWDTALSRWLGRFALCSGLLVVPLAGGGAIVLFDGEPWLGFFLSIGFFVWWLVFGNLVDWMMWRYAFTFGAVKVAIRDREHVKYQVGDAVGDHCPPGLIDQIWGQLADEQRSGRLTAVCDRVRAHVSAQTGQTAEGALGWAALESRCGEVLGVPNHMRELSYYDYFARVLDLAGCRRFDGLCQVARNAGYWWAFPSAAILCERPVVLARDEDGRLHCASGPALAYPDGSTVWAWHGLRVPSRVIEAPQELTPAEIRAEPNVAVRRVMIERYGAERYLRDAGARRVAADDYGTLWRCEQPADAPVVMVEVLNSTPEPDGSFKNYWLRVPPQTHTPREAVAWTFGLRDTDYDPQVQT